MTTTEIVEFARSREHSVIRRGEAHMIQIDVPPYVVEVCVPDVALEWSVTVRDVSGCEIFSDWCDHYAGGDDLSQMTSSVMAFIAALRPGHVRVVKPEGRFFARPRLEVRMGDSWTNIWDDV